MKNLLANFLEIFKYKFHGSQPSGRSIFPCGRMDDKTDGIMVKQTDRFGEGNFNFSQIL